MYSVILVIVCVLVYIIKSRKFDHIAEIAVISGGIINVILFLISSIALGVDISMGKLILWALASMLISYIVEGFTRVLDYTRVENVRFEDDDYYYYVKAVPKAKVTASHNKIKNITKMEKEKTIDETLEHDLSFVGETLKRSVNEAEDDFDLDESDDLQRVDDYNKKL